MNNATRCLNTKTFLLVRCFQCLGLIKFYVTKIESFYSESKIIQTNSALCAFYPIVSNAFHEGFYCKKKLIALMFYVDLLGWLDILSKYYPRFHSNELLLLADDAVKWMSDELPEDSSAVLHLRKYFTSPAEAVRMLWREVYSVAMPYMNVN